MFFSSTNSALKSWLVKEKLFHAMAILMILIVFLVKCFDSLTTVQGTVQNIQKCAILSNCFILLDHLFPNIYINMSVKWSWSVMNVMLKTTCSKDVKSELIVCELYTCNRLKFWRTEYHFCHCFLFDKIIQNI